MTEPEHKAGWFGEFGGQYAPETLKEALDELWSAYQRYSEDRGFQSTLSSLLRDYAGRPTPLYFASNLSKKLGGAQIYLKREDLVHGGAHKMNNAVGQALLAKVMGKTRIIAETGAGQHGVATAMAAALLGIKAEIYMGTHDMARQRLNVYRMKLLGAQVHPVESGSKTLKDAINEALRDWITNVRTTYYLLGSVVGPHPYPTIVRDLQSVIGKEIRTQSEKQIGRLPDTIVACVGGGSNAMGTFAPFISNTEVQLVGVQAGGQGLEKGMHAAPLIAGLPGVLQGMRTMVLQDDYGQIQTTHSIAAGLDYSGVGPQHAYLKAIGRAKYETATDEEAVAAFMELCRLEGIIPALESSHAVAYVIKHAPEAPKDSVMVVTLSGRGDKDVESVAAFRGEIL